MLTFTQPQSVYKKHNSGKAKNKPDANSFGIQAKLKIGQPGDKYEQEADQVASQISRMPLSGNGIQMQKADEEDILQAKAESCPACEKRIEEMNGGSSDDIISRVKDHTQNCQGKSLPDKTRAHFESKMNADFSGVKVHTCKEAASLCNSIQAKAFTHKNQVFFNEGQFAPDTANGKKLLAHELTHVVQRGNAPEIQNSIVQKDSKPEKDWLMLKPPPAYQQAGNTC